MLKKIFLPAAALTVLLITGCEILQEAMKPKEQTSYVLSLHQIIQYPRSKELEKKITSFDGREYWINTNQFFHSRNIEKVELIQSKERKGFYDLSLKLDHNGILKWIQLSMHFRGEKLALLIDGNFYKLYVPDQLANEEDEWVLLKGPVYKVTAKGLQKFAHKNYLFF
ncbi:MAG: hypothetical protein PHV82_00725, partial [Victivallaceae bacterium]|nr:hypothetical protein [Victivallaceae bacterium]